MRVKYILKCASRISDQSLDGVSHPRAEELYNHCENQISIPVLAKERCFRMCGQNLNVFTDKTAVNSEQALQQAGKNIRVR